MLLTDMLSKSLQYGLVVMIQKPLRMLSSLAVDFKRVRVIDVEA